jgi:anthranilate phosphoribosyltransferase
MITFKQALPLLEAQTPADPSLVREVFDAILDGSWSPTQTAAFAIALRMKGETPEVIAAAAKTLRDHMIELVHDLPETLDTCGTGGDGLGSLNLSTGAAIIAAAAGAPVAKHGNRAVSSKSGSADVLEHLGIRLDLTPQQASRVFSETGIVFLFAPIYHPAMRHVAPARKELGVRTIFNCLGPLASPARATHQLLGAYDDALRPVLARTLGELGVKRAWVARGEDGMDEMSPFGPTRITELDHGKLTEMTLSPEDFGLSPCPQGATEGGDAKVNAEVLQAVLQGQEHPSRNAFLLNAAAALCVMFDLPPKEGAERARRALEDGLAIAKLGEWQSACRGV